MVRQHWWKQRGHCLSALGLQLREQQSRAVGQRGGKLAIDRVGDRKRVAKGHGDCVQRPLRAGQSKALQV